MMITESTIYWATRLDTIQCLMCLLTLISGIGLIVSCCIRFFEGEERAGKFCIITLILFSLFGLVAVFIPSTREYAAIKIIPYIANSEYVQKEMPADIKLLKSILLKKIGGENK